MGGELRRQLGKLAEKDVKACWPDPKGVNELNYKKYKHPFF